MLHPWGSVTLVWQVVHMPSLPSDNDTGIVASTLQLVLVAVLASELMALGIPISRVHHVFQIIQKKISLLKTREWQIPRTESQSSC